MRRVDGDKPLTEEHHAAVDRMGTVIRQTQSYHPPPHALVDRWDNETKEDFIKRFIANAEFEKYPSEECEDEQGLHDRIIDRYRRQPIGAALGAEIRAAYQCCGAKEPPFLAPKVLESDRGGKFGVLGDIPMKDVSVAIVAAHVECLGLNLPPRLVASIARRATILLLNRHQLGS